MSRLSDKDRESWHHLWGIAAFQRRDRAEAFRRFKEGLEACPDSQSLVFSLGQEYEHRREIDRMFECFDRCSYPNVSSRHMLAAARYAYLWNRPDKGTAYVGPIAETYFKLRRRRQLSLHERHAVLQPDLGVPCGVRLAGKGLSNDR